MTLSTEPFTARTSPKVRLLSDLAYVQGSDVGPRQRLDLYLPDDIRGPLPVLISAPGGGLVEGDKANDTHIGQRFARAGFATAVVNYRLSPEVRHPGHVEDLAAAVGWVRRSIAEHGGDPERVFLTGHSAGAYLAALLVTDPRYLAAQKLTVENIRGLIAVSGFYWVERVAPKREKHIWGAALQEWHDASPASYWHARLPPTLFVHADGDDDDRRAQNIDAARAARDAGSSRTESVEIANRNHRSLWTHVADHDDPLARRILEFLRTNGG